MNDDERLARALAPSGLRANRDGDPALDADRALLARLGLALGARTPSLSARARLLAALDPSTPFAGFERRLGRFFDLPDEAVADVIARSADPTQWEAFAAAPALRLFHFGGGPRVADADNGFVRFPAGLAFPTHRHLGDEYMFFVTGGAVDDHGLRARPGDIWYRPRGTTHSFTVSPEVDCLCAVIVYDGIEFVP